MFKRRNDLSPTISHWLAALAIALSVSPALAHPESVSSLRLTLESDGIHLLLILPTRDLSRWFPPGKYKNYQADVARELNGMAKDLAVVACDDQVVVARHASAHVGLIGQIVIEADYPLPSDAESLQVQSAMLLNLPNDHQQVAMVEDARAGSTNARILVEQTLTAQQDVLDVRLPEPPAAGAPVASAKSPAAVAAVYIPTTSPTTESAWGWKRIAATALFLCMLLGVVLRSVLLRMEHDEEDRNSRR